MGVINTICTKEDFEAQISTMIKNFEDRILDEPDRANEWQDVIWGMHRVLQFLDVNITENNDIL